MSAMEIRHLYISRGHNFVGHHGGEPDTHPMIEVPEIECVAGRGICGDRYFDFKDDYKGQITFFSFDVFVELCDALKLRNCSPAAARRNVITHGVDLNEFIGREFEVQGICLYGTEAAAPCHWMDRAFAPGARDFLKGRGGLRAKVLCDGLLRSTALVSHPAG
jgi:MOSC domain-containing protein YiiM